MPWIVKLIPNNDTSLYNSKCATCHRENRQGSPQAPSLIDIGQRHTRDEIVTIIREGTGRMPGNPDMGARNINDLVDFLLTGRDKGADPELMKEDVVTIVVQERIQDASGHAKINVHVIRQVSSDVRGSREDHRHSSGEVVVSHPVKRHTYRRCAKRRWEGSKIRAGLPAMGELRHPRKNSACAG